MSGAQSDLGIRASAFPPIGDYGFLSDCETTALVAPNGNVEWLCLPRMDSPSVFAAMLDRDAGGFRVGPRRRQRSGGPALHPGDDGARDELGDAHGVGDRPRRALHRALASRHRALPQPPPLADRPRRRPRSAADDRVRPGLGGDQARVRARVRLRRAGGRLGLHGLGLQRGDRALGGHEPPAAAGDRSATRLRGAARAGPHDDARGRCRVRSARLVRPRDARELRGGARASRPGPSVSGRSGSSTARSPTIRGGRTFSAARSRSRASPTRRRGR